MPGEQFAKIIEFSNAAYNECDQILAVVYYGEIKKEPKFIFVKTATEQYPGAELIIPVLEHTKQISLFFTDEMTAGLPTGEYFVEIKRVIAGDSTPIIKTLEPIFLITESETSDIDDDVVIQISDPEFYQGDKGDDGLTPFIGENGNWWIGQIDTRVDAKGNKGDQGYTPTIGENGNWWINGTDTGIKGIGTDAQVTSDNVDTAIGNYAVAEDIDEDTEIVLKGKKRSTIERFVEYLRGIFSDTYHNHNLNNLEEKSYNSLDDLPDLSLKADLVNGLIPTSQLPAYVDDVVEIEYWRDDEDMVNPQENEIWYRPTDRELLAYVMNPENENLEWMDATIDAGKIYVKIEDNSTYRWSGTTMISLSNPLSYASQAEAEAGTETTKVMSAIRVLQSFVYQLANKTISALTTTDKTVIGAINEQQTAIGNKVDKVTGKGLSANDFTNTLKTKLDGIETGAKTTYIEGYYSGGVFYSDVIHEHAITPVAGKTYLNLDDNKQYRYSGSAFVLISKPSYSASDVGAQPTKGADELYSSSAEKANWNGKSNASAVQTTPAAYYIDMSAADEFIKTIGSASAFTISNAILRKPFRLILTGGTLAATLFTGYTANWIYAAAAADYVPGSTNYLYCEIRSAGQIYLFWGE